MKNKIMFIVAIMISISLGVSAQSQGGHGRGGGMQSMPPAQRAQNAVTKMSGQMTLTQTQKDSLTKIFTDFYTTASAYRQQGNMEGMKSLADSRDQRVKSALNNDKLYAQYQKYIADQKAKMRQRMSGDNGGNGN